MRQTRTTILQTFSSVRYQRATCQVWCKHHKRCKIYWYNYATCTLYMRSIYPERCCFSSEEVVLLARLGWNLQRETMRCLDELNHLLGSNIFTHYTVCTITENMFSRSTMHTLLTQSTCVFRHTLSDPDAPPGRKDESSHSDVNNNN